MTSDLGMLNASIGVTGLVLCCLGVLQVLAGTKTDRHTEHFFFLCYTALFLFDGSNLAGQLMRGQPGLGFRVLLYVSNFVEFLSPALLVYIVSGYLLSRVDPDRQRIAVRTLFTALTLAHLLLLIISQFNDLYYVIDDNNVYHRSTAYALSYLLPVVMIGTDFLFLLQGRRRLSRREIIAFSLYLSVPTIAMVLQLYLYGVYFIVLATILAALVMYVFIISDQTERYTRQVEENASLQVEIMLSQIQPHFLFNTLAAIGRLCRNDPEAKEAINKFARYLRGNMDSLSHQAPIPFSGELAHTKAYLELEQLRFGEELKIEYDLEVQEFLLPTLTLQPLVENAVRHGVRARENGAGTVTIATRERADSYEIIITDDGPGFDPSAPRPEDGRSHVGLDNVRERLRRVSGGELRIESEPGKGTKAIIVLPK
jgi:signal transduction histidine kinase